MNIIQRLFPCMEKMREASVRHEKALTELKDACDDTSCKIVTPPVFDERHLIVKGRT